MTGSAYLDGMIAGAGIVLGVIAFGSLVYGLLAAGSRPDYETRLAPYVGRTELEYDAAPNRGDWGEAAPYPIDHIRAARELTPDEAAELRRRWLEEHGKVEL